jgi:hypothetical protein
MGNRLSATDKALVDAAGKSSSDDKRTAQAVAVAAQNPQG